MNIYASDDYREILKTVIAEHRLLDDKVNFQNMASHMRIPKSYLSRVVHGKADLSGDQLYLACEFLNFSDKERSYLFLLLEYARAGLKRRKSQIKALIEVERLADLDTKQHLKNTAIVDSDVLFYEYYLDARIQLVHVCLTIPRYRNDLGLLAKELRISNHQMLKIINKLEQMNIISRDEAELKILIKKMHLPRSSPVYKAWRNQLKLMAMRKLDDAEDADSYSFSVVFASDTETQNQIRRRFLTFLKEVEKLAGTSAQHDTYQMSFDLFAWTKS